MSCKPKSNGDLRVLICSDLHGCYLDRKAFQVFLAVASEFPWDLCVVNGDLVDFSQISNHEGKIRSSGHEFFDVPTLDEELLFTKTEILKPLRKALPKTKILLRKGNHETRWEEVKMTNHKALAELLRLTRKSRSLELEDILSLDQFKIDLSHNGEDVLGGCFTLIHGDALSKTAAKTNLMRYGSGTSGHTHRMSMYTDVVYGRRHGWFESGCLRTTKNVEYLPFGKRTDWSTGFLDLYIRGGKFFCQNHFIIDNETVFRGQVFRS